MRSLPVKPHNLIRFELGANSFTKTLVSAQACSVLTHTTCTSAGAFSYSNYVTLGTPVSGNNGAPTPTPTADATDAAPDD